MFRTFLVGMLLLASLVPAASAVGKLPDVEVCKPGVVCPFVRADQYGVCAGIGIGLQGVAACVVGNPPCVVLHYGFNDLPLCGTITLA